MSDITYLPCYSLTPASLTLYEIPDKPFFTNRQIKSFDNLMDNENKYFEISAHSRKRLKKSIDFLLYISSFKNISGTQVLSKNLNEEIEINYGKKFDSKIKYKLTFITLTLSAPQHNTDEEIKSKLLNHFLTIARTKFNVDFYIWKAEKQENQNIHFHILTNQFIKHAEIRNHWNLIQNKPGFDYVNLYSEKMQAFFKNGFKIFPNDKRSKSIQLEAYHRNKLINWTNPNSTDIHSLYKIQNISAYMSKYLSKSVTKTERTSRMQFLYSQLDSLSIKLAKYRIDCLFSPDSEQIIYDLENQIKTLTAELEELKKKGVSGRIWGQSQNLSKLKSYSDIQQVDNIPDFKNVVKYAEHMTSFKAGNRLINHFNFDVNNTPLLKSILDNHINSCLENSNSKFFD